MAVYKQFNTNEVVVSPFKANKRFRFENSQVSSSDVQIEYYQSQQGTYLSGSFDTGFNTMQDGVTIFSSIKQLYYSNYLTASIGDPMVTASFIPGQTGPQGQDLGFNQYVGNTTGPRFENFLQSSLTQDRKFAQFSASKAPIGFAGTDTKVTQSAIADLNANISSTKLSFVTLPDLLAKGINETYVLSYVEWPAADIANSPFQLTIAPLLVGAVVSATGTTITSATNNTTVDAYDVDTYFTTTGGGTGASIRITAAATVVTQITFVAPGIGYSASSIITITAAQLNVLGSNLGTVMAGGDATFAIAQSDLNDQTLIVNASQLVEERIDPNVNGTLSGLTLKNNNLISFINDGSVGDDITLYYLQKPKGPSVISIPSMLYGEAIQPSSFRFEYTSSINFTRSIVDDDGQGNLIVTQSNSSGTEIFSGSIGQIFYSQGIAVITGPDSGSLREFAHNVGYKDNMNPNIISSSLSYSSSITIDENQYKCTVRDDEFSFTTNPSALGPPGTLTSTNNQLFTSFNAENLNLAASSNDTYSVIPRNRVGDVQATTFYIFGGRASKTTIGQQYRVELVSSGDNSLEFVGWNGNGNGVRNSLDQVQFNSTGSAIGIAQGFCNAINDVNGFDGEISASLQSTVSGLDTVKLTQVEAGTDGNTRIKYADSFNLLLAAGAFSPTPSRGQEYFGNTNQPAGNPQPVSGTDTFQSSKGAILNVVVSNNSVTSINVSTSISPGGVSQSFSGTNYSVGDRLEILASQIGGGAQTSPSLGTGSIQLTSGDVEKEQNTQIYHDFCTGSYFSPYVTTVGLYNESNDLVCVGKLARPLPISLYTDTTFMINFDTN